MPLKSSEKFLKTFGIKYDKDKLEEFVKQSFKKNKSNIVKQFDNLVKNKSIYLYWSKD
jgi:hypothetical protein